MALGEIRQKSEHHRIFAMFVAELLKLLRAHSIAELEQLRVSFVKLAPVEGVPIGNGFCVLLSDFLDCEVRVNHGAVFPSLKLCHGFAIMFLGNNSILHFPVEFFSLGIDATNDFERGVHNFMNFSAIASFHLKHPFKVEYF